MRSWTSIPAAAAFMALLAGCGGAVTGEPDGATNATDAFAWPASLTVLGDGFPTAGASCRRIGESAATIDMLDDSAALVGCPSREDADKLGGRFLDTVDGVFLVSVPNNAAAAAPAEGDALVAGTGYNATAQISCSGYKGAAAGMCDAGVIRSGETGGITVEVKLADGTQRVIFFNPDGSFLSFSTAEADGTAAMAISSQKKGDITTAKIGTETYEIPDAFVMGG